MRRPSLPTPGVRPLAAALGAALLVSGCGAGQLAQTRVSDSVIDGINVAVGDIALRYVYVEAPPEGGPEGYEEGDNAPLFATLINQVDEGGTLQGVTTDAAREVVILQDTGGDDTFGRDGDAAGPGPGDLDGVGDEETTADVDEIPPGTIGDDEAVGGDAEADGEVGSEAPATASESPSAEAGTASASPAPSAVASGEGGQGGQEVSTLPIPSRLDTQLVYGVDYSFELRGLTRPLRPGELLTVTFRFDSGTEEFQVPVQALNVFPSEQEPPPEEEGEE